MYIIITKKHSPEFVNVLEYLGEYHIIFPGAYMLCSNYNIKDIDISITTVYKDDYTALVMKLDETLIEGRATIETWSWIKKYSNNENNETKCI